MKLDIKKGVTSELIEVFISDSSATDGSGLTGVLFLDIIAYYYRSGAASAVQLASLKTMTVGTWASEGFIEIDSANMPGYYQLGLPDAAIVTGCDKVNFMLKGAANMAPLPIEIQLVDNIEKDTYDIVNHASYGNAQLVRSTTPDNTLDVDLGGNVNVASFGALAQEIWDKATSTLTTVGSIGKLLVDRINASISSRAVAGDNMNLADNAITAGKYDEASAFPVKADDSGNTQIARTGSDGDTLEALSDQSDSIAIALTAHDAKLAPVSIDGSGVTIGAMLTKIVDDNGGADFDATTDSLEKLRDAIIEDTEDIQLRIPATLTGAGNIKSDVLAINNSTDAALLLALSAGTEVKGAAIAGTLSTTEMTTDLTEATNNHYNGRTIGWTSGILFGQYTAITAYDGAAKKLTYVATTEAPGIGDTFIIV